MLKRENRQLEHLDEEIILPAYLGSNMVLQRDVIVRLMGRQRPDQATRIVLERLPADGRPILPQDAKYGVVFEDVDRTDRDGFFDFRLPSLEASFDPYRITLTCGETTRVLSDILIGDVWLAGGGANMALPLDRSDAAAQIEQIANVEHVRVFKTPENGLQQDLQAYSYVPLDMIPGSWQKADDADAVRDVSAIAFSFARSLYVENSIPVGIVDVAASGTYLHSWLARSIVEGDTFIKGRAREVKQYRDQSNWNLLKPDKDVVVRDGQPASRAQMRRPTIGMDQPDQHQFDPKNQPSAMFNHKLAPFIGLALRGLLWYPGENEVDAPDAYARAFRYLAQQALDMFVAPERKPAMLYAQLAPGYYPNHDFKQVAVFNEMLAHVRRTLPIPAGYVTCYDLPLDYGTDLPSVWDLPYLTKAKMAIGARLCSIAQGLVYGKDHASSAPEPKAMDTIGNKLMLDFENVGALGRGLRTRDDESIVKGFAVCGPDRVYVPAAARILHGVQIMVWHDEITEPESLTYGFANFNLDSNLVSSEGIPVTSFRMDLTPSYYAKPMAWTDCDRLEQFVWPRRVSSIRRARKEDWPTRRPLWQVTSGRGDLDLSKEHVRYGDQSILISYKNADGRPIVFEPILSYASQYPPFDVSMWRQMTAHLYSVDHAGKDISLHLEDENQVAFSFPAVTLDATYRFQQASFDLSKAQVNLEKIVRLSFTVSDAHGAGRFWLDRIQFSKYNGTSTGRDHRE